MPSRYSTWISVVLISPSNASHIFQVFAQEVEGLHVTRAYALSLGKSLWRPFIALSDRIICKDQDANLDRMLICRNRRLFPRLNTNYHLL